MKRRLFAPMLTMAILTFACGSGSLPNVPDQSGVETMVASTLQSLTPAVSAPSVPTYQYENVSLAIPNDLGSGATSIKTDEVELPFVNPSNGPMPQHIVLEINGYPLARGSRIMVFKASDYSAYSEITQQAVSTLQSLQYQVGQPLPDELSVGPFNTQAQSLSFQNGRGLRYITEILTAALPISNDQTFYYYQGLTNDGVYYISAILPVSAPFLASDGNPESPLPFDGIPFPNSSNAQDYDTYYTAITEKLNTADAGAFQPALSTLDALIQSIAIQ